MRLIQTNSVLSSHTKANFSHTLKVSELNCWFFKLENFIAALLKFPLKIYYPFNYSYSVLLIPHVLAWSTFQLWKFLFRIKEHTTQPIWIFHIFLGGVCPHTHPFPFLPGRWYLWCLTLCQHINLRALMKILSSSLCYRVSIISCIVGKVNNSFFFCRILC